MPSSKAILRDIADFKLDPKVPYTKKHLEDGRVKKKVLDNAVVEDSEVDTTETDAVVEIKKPLTEEPKKHKPSTAVDTGSSKHKKAINSNDSFKETSISSGKQKVVEEPTTVGSFTDPDV